MHDGHDTMMMTLPASFDAPRHARREVDDWLDALGSSSTFRRDVGLVVSELVTNAVEHAHTAPGIEVTRHGPQVRVAVHDGDPRVPEIHDGGVTGGFGLHIVARAADSWGWERSAGGKVVWAEMADAALDTPGGSDDVASLG